MGEPVKKRTRSPYFAGEKVNMLTAVARVDNGRAGQVMWKYRCDCGNETVATACDFRKGHTKSCGCLYSSKCPPFVPGEKYGRLTALRQLGRRNGQALWEYQCDCGEILECVAPAVRDGRVKSCGCHKRETLIARNFRHGQSDSPEYTCWLNMHQRCHNESLASYMNYGGRGISVCERWSSFELFFADMGPKLSPDYSIDRIDNDGNYEPGNCRWADRVTQNNNTRRSRKKSSSLEAEDASYN